MKFTGFQRKALRLGATLLSRYCEESSKQLFKRKLKKAGHEAVVAKEAIDSGADDAILALEQGSASEDQLGMLNGGMAILMTNMRAAKGTMIGLEESDMVEKLESQVADLEEHVLPLLEDQGSLSLGAGGTATEGDEPIDTGEDATAAKPSRKRRPRTTPPKTTKKLKRRRR